MIGKIKRFLLSNQNAKQTVLKNAFWLMGGEMFGRVIRAAIVIFSARLLGAAEYGVFSYAIAIAGFLTIFADIGLSSVLTREAVKTPELRHSYFSTAFGIKLFLVVINIGLVLFVAPLVTKLEGAKILLPIVAFILVFDTLREFGFGLNRVFERMEREAFVKVVTNLAIVIFGFWLLLSFKSAYALSVAYMIGSGIGFIVTCWILRDHLRDLAGSFNLRLVKPILSVAWPIGLLGVLGAIMINTDMVMLGWWLDAEQVGYYSSAQKIIQLLYIIPTLFASAAFPIFTRLYSANPDRFKQVLEKMVSASIGIALPIAIGGVLFANEVISLFYGAEYLPASLTFGILTSTVVIVYPSVVITNALFAINEQKRFVTFVLVGAITNAFFNALLIPRFGIEGAAFATLGSQILSNFLVWRHMRALNGFSLHNRVTRIVLASLIMGAITFALRSLPILIVIAIGALVYLVTLLLLREPLIRETLDSLQHSGQPQA